MTINQIKYVLGVADCGSLNKASEKLYISQPSLTSAVHELEYEIVFQLFSRSARGVTVTDHGKQFIEDARSLYRNYETLVKKYTEKEKKTFSEIWDILSNKGYKFRGEVHNGYAIKTKFQLCDMDGNYSFVDLIKRRNGLASWETIKIS